MPYFKHFFSFLLLLSLIVSVSAQDKLSKKSKWHHVKQIKDGIILVRLINNDKQVFELKKAGMDTKAADYEAKNKALNDQIKKAFSKYYNFSDHYYYYSNDAKILLKGKTEGLVTDKEGNVVNLDLSQKNIYVAEFGYANAPGSTERYNKRGFLIKQLDKQEFIRLPSALFYFGTGHLEKKPQVKINTAVHKMNIAFLKHMTRLEANPGKRKKRLEKQASKF